MGSWVLLSVGHHGSCVFRFRFFFGIFSDESVFRFEYFGAYIFGVFLGGATVGGCFGGAVVGCRCYWWLQVMGCRWWIAVGVGGCCCCEFGVTMVGFVEYPDLGCQN